MEKLNNSPFRNIKLENHNIEKIAWEKLSVAKRLETALSWGKEIDWMHKKLYGEKLLLKRIREDFKGSR